ncbi:sodium:proton exchanger [Streptomyces sp. NBC_00647]|uniref:cation:proton antiporter n=1 Tax=Streptomyces sp. NBC_00647 TaxID=2975796 RepID=UPI003248C23A
MTDNQILEGLGLIVVLAVGSQLVASRLRIPALIVLLPVGFAAGALTDIVNPDKLLGDAFSPMVSLAVAVILYEAGLGLNVRKLHGHMRRVVVRLIWLGVLITWAATAALAVPLLGMSKSSAVMLGVILVVSGPTVVGPLLNFVRPTERLQRILIWEGSLIDPVGGILGALAFHAVVASDSRGVAAKLGQFVVSSAVGLIGGAVGAAVLWFLLSRLHLGEVLGTTAQLAAAVGVAAACDAIRDDTGLIAAVVMGMALANLPGMSLPARRPFLETLVSLIIGLLFISISATVTPASLRHVILPTLVLVAALVLVIRPAIAFLSTAGTDVPRGERAFIGWMAPRGIVAAATASTFSATLVAEHIGGAQKILPATFLVIVTTVTLYGLSAHPVARRLGVLRPARARPLLVGGDLWAIDMGRALRTAGLDVLMWAGREQQRDLIRAAGLHLAPGELLAAATGEGAELEGITGVLLLTEEDDFNALASATLRGNVDGFVHRLGPPGLSHGVVAPYTSGDTLFGAELNRPELARRYADGARITARPAGEGVPAGHALLFLVRPDGRLDPVTRTRTPQPGAHDTVILLGPSPEPGPVRAG